MADQDQQDSPRHIGRRNNGARGSIRAQSTDAGQFKGRFKTYVAAIAHENSPRNEGKRRIQDATSDRELHKAMTTFLNRTGAADYNLPKLTGEKIMVSRNQNQPSWQMHDKTKLTWFPGRDVDFKGSSSPPATNYSPKSDRPYPQLQYSVGNQKRFHIPSSVNKLHKQIPHQYESVKPGLHTGNSQKYDFNRVSMGFGNKCDFTNSKNLSQIPGAKYEAHNIESIGYKSKKNNPSSEHGFYNKYNKWEKTCYKGMEQHFYMRETKGPGAYLNQDFKHMSPTQKASNYSIPRRDRGLLTFQKPRVPGPGNYEYDAQAIKSRIKDATFAMPKASRDVSFSKYGSEHAHLIRKGLF